MRARSLLFPALAWLIACGAAGAADPIRSEVSVVRITNYSQRGDWYSPWDTTRVGRSYGSGFVVSGGLVMTNAHVISDSRLLLIQPWNDPESHPAEVVHVAHDCDLALIRPLDPAPLEGIPPLFIGELPELGSTVRTLGYPTGGTQISSTQGVVSRIEDRAYVHSAIDGHLTVQTDAAINPGNSGGPVLLGDRVVGVAFQANLELEDTGFFIPPEVIRRFQRDVEDGQYDGYPELGASWSGLANPTARRYVGLDPDETGVRVDGVAPGASADGLLLEGDVILAVEGRNVGSDGSVADGGLRIPFGLLVDRKQIGESVVVRVLRDGDRLDVTVPLRDLAAYSYRARLYDVRPRYYIYAGLVFVPLNLEMLRTFGSDWLEEADDTLLYEYYMRPALQPEILRQERVVLLRRLIHPVNADLAWFRNEVLERVNGQEVTSLEALAAMLESYDGDYQLFEFSSHRRFGVLDRRQSEAAHQEILERYGVLEDRHL